MMQNDPRSTPPITGYSDREEVAPKALAKRRAEAVRSYLVNGKKLDTRRIETCAALRAQGGSVEEKKKNRRIEIVFYPEGTR